MADIRSMLRSELASRSAPAVNSKKRKATHDDSAGRKKLRNDAANEDASKSSGSVTRNDERRQVKFADHESPIREDAELEAEPPAGPVADEAEAASADPVNEEEWAAFQRDVASPPQGDNQEVSAFNAPASIQAQPLTASELAAKAREEQSIQKGRREAELEEEKEDAARQLEDEFDEMESLEERARRLREKREALRQARESEVQRGVDLEVAAREEPAVEEGDRDRDSDSDNDDDDDDDDTLTLWRLK